MKFSTYQPAVGRNVMNPPAVQAPRDAMAFGTGGKEWDGLQAGLGQVIKVVQKQQDEDDYLEAVQAKNNIRTQLTEGLYGEGGLFETGVGENARGLTDRVTDFIQQTYRDEASKHNGRVQRLLLGDYNENTMNYQRISASKEMGERDKLLDENYANAIDQAVNLASMNPGDAGTLALEGGEIERNVYSYGKMRGWNGAQITAELRKGKTQMVQGVVQSLLANDRMDDALTILTAHKGSMDQKVYNQLYGSIKKDKDTRDELAMASNFMNADGTYNWDGFKAEVEKTCGKDAKRWVQDSAGGSFTGDATMDGEIVTAAQASDVDPVLVAAVANAESGFNQGSASGVGALGVMQLMPDTAAELGVDPNDRAQNFQGGAKYLRQMLDQYNGNMELAVAAYNAGRENVSDHIPQNGETPGFVQRVMDYYNAHKNAKPAEDTNARGTIDASTLGLQHFRKWSSAEGMDTPWDSNDTTDTAHFKQGVATLLQNLDKTGYDYVITGGAEHNYHATGAHSHENGYKVDISDQLDDKAVNALYEQVQALGGTINHETSLGHYDIMIPPTEGESAGGASGHWESAYDPVKYERLMKIGKAKKAEADAALQAKKDTYGQSVMEKIYNAPDGTTAVAILTQEQPNITPEWYTKSKAVINSRFPGTFKEERASSPGSGRYSGPRSQQGNGNDEELRGAALGWSNKLNRLRELAYQSMQNGKTFDDTNDDHNFENYRVALEDFLTTQYAKGNDKQDVLDELDRLANDYESYREYWQG